MVLRLGDFSFSCPKEGEMAPDEIGQHLMIGTFWLLVGAIAFIAIYTRLTGGRKYDDL